MNPALATFFRTIGVEERGGRGEPADFSSDAPGAIRKGFRERVPDAGGTTDAVEKPGLKNAWYAKGRGSEEDAERGVRADKKVLLATLE